MPVTDNTATIDKGSPFDNFVQKNEDMTLTGTSLANGHLVIDFKTFDRKDGTIQIVNESATRTVTAQIFHTTNPDAETYSTDDTDWTAYAPAKTVAVSDTHSWEFNTRSARMCLVVFVSGATDEDVSFFMNALVNIRGR